MTNPNMFSQMYLVPKYLYQHLKNTLDFEQSKQIDNINSVSSPDESKNMSEVIWQQVSCCYIKCVPLTCKPCLVALAAFNARYVVRYLDPSYRF